MNLALRYSSLRPEGKEGFLKGFGAVLELLIGPSGRFPGQILSLSKTQDTILQKKLSRFFQFKKTRV
jgi:hypothetical protein